MAFDKPPTQTPAKVGQIIIEVLDPAGIPANVEVNVSIQILAADDKFVHNWNGNLLPHLTTAQKNGILNLLSAIRTKAQAELL